MDGNIKTFYFKAISNARVVVDKTNKFFYLPLLPEKHKVKGD